MTKLQELFQLGQSIWIDQISRELFTSGKLQFLIEQGLRGMTSNPTIFMKAMTGGRDYDEDIQHYAAQGLDVEKIYEKMAIADIQQAADMLRPVFDESDGADGFVSLEARPSLAHDTDGTLDEIRRLHAEVDRPNVMFKIPATVEGFPAIHTLLFEGLPINITLMFSLDQYDAVSEAYLSALEKRVAAGEPVDRSASVASFFVSRMDVKLDPVLKERGATDLVGKIAIANAKMAYAAFQAKFSGERWEKLVGAGARPQRVLWASTSTKDPSFPDTLYVDHLIGPHTVNTLPPDSIDAVMDHGTVKRTVDQDLEKANHHLHQLAELDIDIDVVTDELLDEGVASFSDSYRKLIENLQQKSDRVQAGRAT
jgi:transaldolase